MKNIKEIGTRNIIIKQETMPVGACIARPNSKEHAIEGVGAILINRKPQRNGLKYNQNGITLIALVITIIVLLILASITINLTLGERGIFNTAQKAGQNYKEAQEKEFADLSNFEQEAGNIINGIGNGNKTPTEPTLTSQITASNYGDYVNYPVIIGHGPNENAHKTDWRVFYNDGTYVYLIASYYLLNSEMPEGTGMVGYSGKPYTTYWLSAPSTYTTITDEVRINYKMSWDQGTTNNNIKCVSELLNTTKWKKFAYNIANGKDKDLAEDAIGSPTLEMWVESWNSTGNTPLYCNNSNNIGYYVGTSSTPTSYNVNGLTTSNSLYFPVTSGSDANGYHYWLASPSANYANANGLMNVNFSGNVFSYSCYSSPLSVRPLVRLKSNITAIKDENGVWQLQ